MPSIQIKSKNEANQLLATFDKLSENIRELSNEIATNIDTFDGVGGPGKTALNKFAGSVKYCGSALYADINLIYQTIKTDLDNISEIDKGWTNAEPEESTSNNTFSSVNVSELKTAAEKVAGSAKQTSTATSSNTTTASSSNYINDVKNNINTASDEIPGFFVGWED
ncbi:MAG: hypothetical protein IJ574_02700 [Bacilli bacterium]|nr:hypothetical protein [Bacilli bacterium]